MSREGYSTHCEMASRANKRVVLKAADSSRVLRGHVRQDQLSITRCAMHCSHSFAVRQLSSLRLLLGELRMMSLVDQGERQDCEYGKIDREIFGHGKPPSASRPQQC